MKLTDKCGYLKIAKSEEERRNKMINNKEINSNILFSGTKGYEDKGCYHCTGYDKKCDTYFSPLEEYLKGYDVRTKTNNLIVIEGKK